MQEISRIINKKSTMLTKNITIWLFVALCYGGYSIAQSSSKLCGARLDEALALACPLGFQPKLSHSAALSNMLPSLYKRMPRFFFNQTSTPSLLMMRRARRGVYNECCLKICTRSELISYCQKW